MMRLRLPDGHLRRVVAVLGRNGQPLLRSEPLIRGNRLVGEKKRSPFAVPDHGLDGIEKVFCGPIGIAEFTCASR